ncbi:MAG: Dyp-type peroxidase [Rhizomicrobium sp.]
MSEDNTGSASRRGFLKSAGVIAAVTGSGFAPAAEARAEAGMAEPFYAARQGGILTLPQRHSYFAAFDLDTGKRDDVIAMLRNWSGAAAAMTQGAATPVPAGATSRMGESTETMGLSPAHLTMTFGFGAGLFAADGRDRYGLAHARPDALIDLPRFPADRLVAARTGGDLSVQACADDPQVSFHAIRRLAQLANGSAHLRWTQTAFLPDVKPGETPRNLLGFKDGTSNPSATDDAALAKFVFVGSDGPAWMRGGSYVVVRRILVALEYWDRMSAEFQEQTIGRRRSSGAPFGGTNEFDPVDLGAKDKDGNSLTPVNSHVRLANAASNDGARILRRPYSFNDGANHTAERWPPWRQGMEYEAGLFFVCYQRHPREGFVKIFSKLSLFDRLNEFSTHTGGGLFACPGGIAPGEFVGQRLFET